MRIIYSFSDPKNIYVSIQWNEEKYPKPQQSPSPHNPNTTIINYYAHSNKKIKNSKKERIQQKQDGILA